jgi:hypothetical protein
MAYDATSAYVLAKLHRSPTSQAKAYAASVIVGDRPSARELVTAIDAQAINVYNVRTNQLVASHALSPATRFLCAPVCVLDRRAETRTIYAVMVTGPDDYKLQRWHQQGLNAEPQITSSHLDTAIAGLHLVSGALLLVYDNGDLVWYSLELEQLAKKPFAAIRPGNTEILSHRLVHGAATTLYVVSKTEESVWHDSVMLSDAQDYDLKVSSIRSHVLASANQHHVAISAQGTSASIGRSSIVLQENNSSAILELQTTDHEQFKPSDITSLTFLNDTHLLIVQAKQASIWNLTYSTLQSTIDLPNSAHCATIIKPISKLSKQMEDAHAVFVGLSNIYLAPISFPKSSQLVHTLRAHRSANKLSNSWLVDVDLQATWKESLTGLSAPARACLAQLADVANGAQFDGILEDYLFPSKIEAPMSRKAAQKANKEKSNDEPSKVVPAKKYTSKARFTSYDTLMTPSEPFIAQVLRLALVTLPTKLGKDFSATATLDFLFQTGRFALSSLPQSDALFEQLVEEESMRQRIAEFAAGLLPEHLVLILQKELSQSTSSKRLGTVLGRLYVHDTATVSHAIRSVLGNAETEELAMMLESELHQRLSADEKTNLSVHNDVLCSAVTSVIDALGITNVVLTEAMRSMMLRLRSSVAQMVQETETLCMMTSCISELLFKARLVEPVKTRTVQRKSASNPQPQAREGYFALEKVKKEDKSLSVRSKGLSKSLGVGRYTIERLEL